VNGFIKAVVLNMDIQSPNIRGLDGLRGLAASAVFAVHYHQIVDFDIQLGLFDSYRLFPNGKYGVALFFILSGMLLSLPYWRSIVAQSPWPVMKTYMVRRLARIVPAYYLALTVLILINGLWRVPGGWIDIALHYSFLFNFTEFSIFSINPPFWSLAVEMQFYLILPLIFLVMRRFSPWQACAFLILGGVVAYGLHYWVMSAVTHIVPWPDNVLLTWIRPYGAVVTHSLLANLPLFIFGVVAGWLFICLNQRAACYTDSQRRWSEAGFWCCLVLLFTLLSSELGEKIQVSYARYGLPLIPLLLTVLVVCTPFTRVANKIIDSAVLRRLGLISYGVYIYHLPCLDWVDRTMLQYGWDAPEHWLVLGLASVILTLIIASLSYLIIERPILKWVKSSHS